MLVLAPTGRDQSLILQLLNARGIVSLGCRDQQALIEHLRQHDDAGPVILAEEAFDAAGLNQMLAFLDAQPAWSDLPIIVLARQRQFRHRPMDELIQRRSVRWLSRPIESHTLLSLVRLALEARKRQVEVGQLLQQAHRLNEQLEHRNRQLVDLNEQIIDVEDRERQRLATLLHDDLQQLLVGASLHASVVAKALQNETACQAATAQAMDQVCELVTRAQQTSRNLSHELFPAVLHDQDVSKTLKWLADHAPSHLGMTVELEMHDELGQTTHRMVRFLYRTIRELLSNIAKHAQVSEAKVEARYEDSALVIVIRDHGVGFDPASLEGDERAPSARELPGGVGLRGIRQRAESLDATMRIDTRPGNGTRIELRLPRASDPTSGGGAHADASGSTQADA